LALMVICCSPVGVLLLTLRSAQQGLHHFGWLGLSQAGEGLARVAALFGPLAGVAGALTVMLLGQGVGGICAAGGLLGLGPARPAARGPGDGPALKRAPVRGRLRHLWP